MNSCAPNTSGRNRFWGDKLGVSRQTSNAIETERYDPSLPLAFKIARLFWLTIEYIFDDEPQLAEKP